MTGQGIDPDQPDQSKFDINRTTGEIYVLKPLDRDEPSGRPQWRFTGNWFIKNIKIKYRVTGLKLKHFILTLFHDRTNFYFKKNDIIFGILSSRNLGLIDEFLFHQPP